MRKISFLFITVTFLALQSCHFGTGVGETRPTPKEYLNMTEVVKARYYMDKKVIQEQLQQYLATRSHSFYSKEYFDSTLLNIDTILYSEDKNKIAVFVSTKNPTIRQLAPNPKYQSYYDAFCYLGKRHADTFNLKWLNSFSLINFYDSAEVRNGLRQKYFTQFAALKNTDGKYTYGVNLDDKRFWSSYVWQQYFTEERGSR